MKHCAGCGKDAGARRGVWVWSQHRYLLREGYEVFGVDADAEAEAGVREMAEVLAPGLPSGNFQVAATKQMPFADEFADVVVCNSVLHFARMEAQFDAMMRGLWRVLRPGGMLFCRLGSTIGMEFETVGRRLSVCRTVRSGSCWTRRC